MPEIGWGGLLDQKHFWQGTPFRVSLLSWPVGKLLGYAFSCCTFIFLGYLLAGLKREVRLNRSDYHAYAFKSLL